jgi:hypothetical protein
MDLIALAAMAAGWVVASAATPDAWGVAKRGVARLLGRGDPERERLAEGRLDQTREELQTTDGQGREQARARLEAAWQARLADLLEEHPDAAGDLKAVVDEIRAALPADIVAATDHSIAAGRDVRITASGAGVAAGVIHGNVSPPGPTPPGPAQG